MNISRLKIFISVFIIVLLAGVSMAFFFHADEHAISGAWYEESMKTTTFGYDVSVLPSNAKDYYYKINDENAYIDIVSGRVGFEGMPCDSVIIRFKSLAEKDENVRFVIFDESGNEAYSMDVPWKKGSIYFKADLSAVPDNVKELLSRESIHVRAYVGESFDMPMAYISVPDNSARLNRMALVAAVVLALVAAAMFAFIKPLAKLISAFVGLIKRLIDYIKEYKKMVLGHVAGFFACGVISTVAALITSLVTKKGFGIPLASLYFLGFSFIYMVIFMRKIFEKRIEVFGTLLTLIIGTVFSFAAPAATGLNFDDQDHFIKVVYMSTFLERRVSFADWDNIVEARSALILGDTFEYDKREALNEFRNEMEREHYFVSTSPGASIIEMKNLSYVTSVIPFFIGKLLHLPWNIRFMLGRWGTVIFLTIVAYYSMKSLRSGKMIAFMVAAMPGVIFLAASYSYDIWLLGCIMLGLAMFFGEKQYTEHHLPLKIALWMSVILFCSNFSKPIYFPLFVIAFFMPMYKFKNKRNYWLYKLLNVFTMALPVMMVLISTLMPGLGGGDTRGEEGVNAAGQYETFMNNPIHGIIIIGRYLITYLNPFFERTAWFNRLGYMGTMKIGIYGAIVLTVCSFLSVNRKETAKFPWWYRLGVLAVYVVIGFFAAFSMYIMFTPVGVETVYGCQARYILPAVFPVLFACTRWSGGALLDRVPALDSFAKKPLFGCSKAYWRDVMIALLILLPNMLGVYQYLVR